MTTVHKYVETILLYAACLSGIAIFFVLGLRLYVNGINGNESISDTSNIGSGRQFVILSGLIPPNVSEKGRGREADIIVEAMTRQKVGPNTLSPDQVRFVIEPFGRHWHTFILDDRFDAVATVPRQLNVEGYRSLYYIMYRNVIGYKEVSQPPSPSVMRLPDLRGKRVVAFPGASSVLEGLSDYIGQFALYIERPDQMDHSWLLLTGRVDFVIGDALILSEYNRRMFKTRRGAKEKRGKRYMHLGDIFKATCYSMVFRRKEDQEMFDRSIKDMILDGTLEEIDKRYAVSYPEVEDVHYLQAKGEAPCGGET